MHSLQPDELKAVKTSLTLRAKMKPDIGTTNGAGTANGTATLLPYTRIEASGGKVTSARVKEAR